MEGDTSNLNSNSPLYIDESHRPDLVFVSEPLIGSDNYNKWSRNMLFALAARNKVGFVHGSVPQPSLSNTQLCIAWVRCNVLVICWIFKSVSKEIFPTMLRSGSAYEIWRDLQERFQPKKGPRIFELRKRLTSITQGNDSVLVYFTKLETIWDEILFYKPTCDNDYCPFTTRDSQTENVIYFLMGLNESFSEVRDQILLMDPIPPIIDVLPLLVQEENKQKENASLPC